MGTRAHLSSAVVGVLMMGAVSTVDAQEPTASRVVRTLSVGVGRRGLAFGGSF